MLLIADVNGVSHQELAFASAIARRAGDRHADLPRIASVRETSVRGLLDRLPIILALADEIEARCPPDRPISISSTIGRHVTLELISGVHGELKAFDEVFAIPIAFGVIATPTASIDVGLEAGWSKLLGPQNTFKQRHAAVLVTYRFASATPPPPAGSYTAR